MEQLFGSSPKPNNTDNNINSSENAVESVEVNQQDTHTVTDEGELIEEEEQVVNKDTYHLRKQQDKAMKAVGPGKTGKSQESSFKMQWQLPASFDKLSVDVQLLVGALRPAPQEFNRKLKLLSKLQRFINNYWPGVHTLAAQQ
jgi:hypothetical protein